MHTVSSNLISGKKTEKFNRVVFIDYFKGLLIILMVFAHIMYLPATLSVPLIAQTLSLFIFPGFLFCFGYVCNVAYGGRTIGLKETVKILSRIVLAHYISSIAWLIFVVKSFTLESFFRVLVFSEILSYNDYLLSFAICVFIYLAFKGTINRLASSWHVVIFAFLSIAVFLIPPSFASVPQLGLLIPSVLQIHFFPVIPYFIWFIAGIYFSMNKIKLNLIHAVISLILTLLFYFQDGVFLGSIPTRIPITLPWIYGPAFFIFILYCFCMFLEKTRINLKFLSNIGSNALTYFVISNILIFVLRDIRIVDSFWAYPLYFLFIMGTIYFICAINKKTSS